MLVVAHRTSPRDAPENSLEGIRRSAELGADVVEIDVRRTLGGLPILMHDRTPRRTASFAWPVRLLPSALARRLRLRGNGEPVPTLAAALDALPSTLAVAIDVKHASATRSVIAEVHARRLEARALIWSERASAVRFAVREAPDIEVSLLRDAISPRAQRRFLDDAVRLGAKGISAHWDTVTEAFLEQAHARDLRVYSWCEQHERQAEILSFPLDGVVTEWPAAVRAILDEAQGRPGRAH